MSKSDSVENNGIVVKTSGGNCKTSNIIYAATCKLCSVNNVYVGKTVQPLHKRVNGHRDSFSNVLSDNSSPDFVVFDGNILGYHLFNVHNLNDHSDFDRSYKFDILSNATPSTIRILEQFYIDKLVTRIPFGLNQIDSV